ncbi:MAG: RagB/SusD family nutrient uptake outer membrane protein [Tannerellaceae bacterium]|nr:RagB/SusD family nutrient uptake outer membrane protein [Tannerellaceae bacterium]
MKNNIIKSIGFVLLTVWFSSCDDSFLDRLPKNELTTETFWEQEKDGIQATNACYSIFRAREVTDIFEMEGYSDNGCTARSWEDPARIANGSHTSMLDIFKKVWRNNYECIRRANEVRVNIHRIPDMNETLRKRLIAEVTVLRAYCYNTLTNLYGDVLYFDEPVTLIEDAQKPRRNKSEIVDILLQELKDLAPDLPISYDSSDKGRVTRGTAHALRARIALLNGRYDVAREAAAEVMKPEYGHGLLENYSSVFTYENQNSKEVLLDLQHMPDLAAHDLYERMGPRSARGQSYYVPTRALVDAYEPGDPRLYATMIQPGDAHPYLEGELFNPAPGSGTLDEIGTSYHATISGYQFKKYVLKEDMEFPTRCSINIILLRYAEVLLTFAEAENEINGPTQAALDAINEVRRRARGGSIDVLPDLSGLTQEQLREAIRQERRIELAGEGIRYFDILRWRIAETVMNGTVYGMDYLNPETNRIEPIFVERRVFDKNKNYLWPLPASEIRLNPELAGHQNPGY